MKPLERTASMYFGAHTAPHAPKGRIEPSDMANLEDQPLTPRFGDQIIALRRGHRQRLFHEYVHAGAEKVEAQGAMQPRRSGDHRRLDSPQ